ncbi:phosphatidylinositol-4,5-bisphosphate 3-kinase catalytic subunit alphaisoform [Trichinella spiralis]|uniref:phosphatidylinositol-4,5-bisphosphate 3-kinase catalytic subunit alphaisoform n=1 Tax=Trichinella spiralis TaxID=6334 RepID=UPI0001EFE2DC|nr:phosphatidylinositol-4,5-bisphosphate 3-kinase catalytic subunit alphaisoform [Trichinella spiralis]
MECSVLYCIVLYCVAFNLSPHFRCTESCSEAAVATGGEATSSSASGELWGVHFMPNELTVDVLLPNGIVIPLYCCRNFTLQTIKANAWKQARVGVDVRVRHRRPGRSSRGGVRREPALVRLAPALAGVAARRAGRQRRRAQPEQSDQPGDRSTVERPGRESRPGTDTSAHTVLPALPGGVLGPRPGLERALVAHVLRTGGRRRRPGGHRRRSSTTTIAVTTVASVRVDTARHCRHAVGVGRPPAQDHDESSDGRQAQRRHPRDAAALGAVEQQRPAVVVVVARRQTVVLSARRPTGQLRARHQMLRAWSATGERGARGKERPARTAAGTGAAGA